MEIFDYLEEGMALKGVLKSAMEELGALSVMMTGTTLMLKLCVTSWALHKQVRVFDHDPVYISTIISSWYMHRCCCYLHIPWWHWSHSPGQSSLHWK